MKLPSSSVASVFAAACALALPHVSSAQASQPVFDPFTVLSLHLEFTPEDWEIVRADETFEIEKPAWFHADGEEPILVSVRRKSATPVGDKVSFKVDINEHVDGQVWRGLTKLSLENGDDSDVLAEGVAWMMHRFAAENQPAGGTYQPGLAAWVTLTINGEPHGVYLNVEEVDKQFLRNRSLWKSGQTWLYKQDDIGLPERKEGSTDSPTVVALNYAPFALTVKGKGATSPDEAALAEQLPALIDMEGMLTLGAVNAFSSNPDELFNKGKNFFWADFSTKRRLYFPWDLDAVIRDVDANIYGQLKGRTFAQTDYQKVILNHPLFRQRYNEILLRLLDDGSLGDLVVWFLDELQPVLTPHLEADPDSKMADRAAERFDELRAWIVARHANVRSQVLADLGIVE